MIFLLERNFPSPTLCSSPGITLLLSFIFFRDLSEIEKTPALYCSCYFPPHNHYLWSHCISLLWLWSVVLPWWIKFTLNFPHVQHHQLIEFTGTVSFVGVLNFPQYEAGLCWVPFCTSKKAESCWTNTFGCTETTTENFHILLDMTHQSWWEMWSCTRNAKII